MKKYFVDPNASNAFTSETVHKVVLNNIDFELSDDVWDVIDDAFGYYWNVEVGYGSYPDLNSAVSSIAAWLKKENVIFPIEKIVDIVNVIFDWVEQVPGAILDENEVVIPHSFADYEKERQDFKRLEREWSGESAPNFNDSMTNFVYISDKLKEFFPRTYRRLIKLFDEMEIEWDEIQGTKDIWIRDYMPIQTTDVSYKVYNYNPDYLKKTGEEYLTDSHEIYKGIMGYCLFDDMEITLDGGNVVTCGKYRVLTDKVFSENNKPKYDGEFCSYLQEKLCSDIIFLPWHCYNPHDPDADVYGHADGLVQWTGGKRVLMSNHRDMYPEEADDMRARLEDEGFEVTEMLFDVPQPNTDFNWAYINYLHVGNKIIVPTFGIAEDKQALKYIRESNPDCIVRSFRMREIARNGGAIHCITWNIRR